MAQIIRGDEKSRLKELFDGALRHAVAIRNADFAVAWCTLKGCFKARMGYDSYFKDYYYVLDEQTGDWQAALSDLESELARLDELREKALAGGWHDLTDYVDHKQNIKRKIKQFGRLLSQLDRTILEEEEPCSRLTQALEEILPPPECSCSCGCEG